MKKNVDKIWCFRYSQRILAVDITMLRNKILLAEQLHEFQDEYTLTLRRGTNPSLFLLWCSIDRLSSVSENEVIHKTWQQRYITKSKLISLSGRKKRDNKLLTYWWSIHGGKQQRQSVACVWLLQWIALEAAQPHPGGEIVHALPESWYIAALVQREFSPQYLFPIIIRN